MARGKDHTWPVPVVGLGGLRLGSLIWLYRADHYVTAVIKATYRLDDDELGRPVGKNVRPCEHGGRPHEVLPALSRTDVFVRSTRGGQFHLGVYRGQQTLLQKSGTATELGPLSATKPPRKDAMDSINGGALWRLPESFDWAALQAAPTDQQLRFLSGGEWVVVGVSGDAKATRFQLPAQRPELIVRGAEVEVGTPTLDTVHVDLDARDVTILWRSRITIDAPGALTSMTILARPSGDGDFPEETPRRRRPVEVPKGGWTPVRKLAGKASPQQLTTTMDVGVESAGQALPFQSGVGLEEAAPSSKRGDDVAISFQVSESPEAPVDLGKTMDGGQAPPKRAPLPFETGTKPPAARVQSTGGLPFAGAPVATPNAPPTGTAPPPTSPARGGLPFGEAKVPPPYPSPTAPQPGPPPSRPGPRPPVAIPPPIAVPPPEPVPAPAPVAPPPLVDPGPASTPKPEPVAETQARDEPVAEVPTVEERSSPDEPDEDELETIAPPPLEDDSLERDFYTDLKEQQRKEQRRQQVEAEARDERARQKRAAELDAERARARQISETIYSFNLKQ